MDGYRPSARRTPPEYRSSSRFEDEARHGYRREYERYDSRDRGRYRSRSPRRLDYDDVERGSERRERSGGYRRDTSAYDRQVEYDYYVSESEYLRDYQEQRAPPAQRPYRPRGPYEEEYYEPPAVVDVPYTGENDASVDGKPLRLLLVRNLKESVTEELFAKGLEKLSIGDGSTTGAIEGSLRRVMIIRHRETEKSMTFGFAEYHKVDDASAALAKAQELGEKCTIASRVVEVSFPHLTVFPRADFGVQESSEKYTVEMPSTGQRHKYHDLRYYPSELLINVDSPYETSSPPKDAFDDASSTLDVKDKSKKRKAPGATTTAPAFLQHWQNKAAELRSDAERVAAEKEQEKATKASRPPASGVNAIIAPAVEHEQTFAIDTHAKKCCFLCLAQFQTSEALQRHLKESAKHAENARNEDAKKTGYERLKKNKIAPDSTIRLLGARTAASLSSQSLSDQAETDKQYRDRAAERRKVEAVTGNESMPSFSLRKSNKPSPATSDAEPSQPAYGKGLGMLQKAGWTAGQGLGSGNGIAAPIEQSVYAAGVGLGHESSKKGDAVEEAAKMTKGDRAGFLESTKDLARRRYESMG